MAVGLEQKKAIVAEVNQIAKESITAVVVENRGLNASQVLELRKSSREETDNDVSIKVVRNTLAKRAFEDTEFKCLNESLVGPVFLAFSKTDPGASARVIKQFQKGNKDQIEVKALSINGEMLEANQLDTLASLPTRDEALAKLMNVMQAPIVKLLRTLQAPQIKLVRTIMAIKDQKEEQS